MSEDPFKYIASHIPNSYYFDERIFNEEKSRIFENTWHYVGLRSDFSSNNDFFTLDVGNTSVVVQQFNGVLRAFHNVCTHRFKKIQVEERGNRYLTCQYHGWTYNEKGVPYGIPMKSEFEDLSPEILQTLCLKEFRLEYCGAFIFVNVSNEAVNLKEFLGDNFDFLSGISNAIGKKYVSKKYLFNANWKLVVENTLEGYHLSSVHPKTFGKIGLNSKSDVDFNINGLHSSFVTHQYGESSIKQMKKFELIIKDRPYRPDGFFHQLVFPNMLIGSAFGFTFYVGYISPLTATSSEFVFHFYETKLNNDKTVNEEISKALSMTTVEFNDNVMSEDIEMVNYVQLGISQSKAAKCILSSKEKRIHHFQETYMKLFEEGVEL